MLQLRATLRTRLSLLCSSNVLSSLRQTGNQGSVGNVVTVQYMCIGDSASSFYHITLVHFTAHDGKNVQYMEKSGNK